MELWAFDRSGPYSSGEFDIHNEPMKFIKTITGYANMSDEVRAAPIGVQEGC